VADGQFREQPCARIHGGVVRCLAFAPDSSILASAVVNDHINVWDAATGQGRRSLGEGHDFVPAISCSPDGNILIAAKVSRTIQFWNVAMGREQVALRVESDGLRLAFSDDGPFVTSGVGDGTVRVWNLAPALRAD
jgi:WD40 repeat protein